MSIRQRFRDLAKQHAHHIPSPTAALPGSPEKVEILRLRVEAGEALFLPPGVDATTSTAKDRISWQLSTARYGLGAELQRERGRLIIQYGLTMEDICPNDDDED